MKMESLLGDSICGLDYCLYRTLLIWIATPSILLIKASVFTNIFAAEKSTFANPKFEDWCPKYII